MHIFYSKIYDILQKCLLHYMVKLLNIPQKALSLRDGSFVSEDTPLEVFANGSMNGWRIWEIDNWEDELMKM